MDWIIKYWIQAVFTIVLGLLTGAVTGLYNRQGAEKKKREAAQEAESAEQALIKNALIAILHDRLYSECMQRLQAGYISVSALKNLNKLYDGYHSLGGNSMGTDLYNRCLKLDIVDDIPKIEKEA